MGKCNDCGQATISNGVCTDCSDKRFVEYPKIKTELDGNLKILKRCQELATETELRHLRTIRAISGMNAYIDLLMNGDPESEDPKAVLEFFEAQFKQILKDDHNCQGYDCLICDP